MTLEAQGRGASRWSALFGAELEMTMSMDYIRKSYGVPAKRGGRVEYTGDGEKEFGTITGADGHYLRVRLDGGKEAGYFHPTWELRYLTPNA